MRSYFAPAIAIAMIMPATLSARSDDVPAELQRTKEELQRTKDAAAGPEYLALLEATKYVDPNSKGGQEIVSIFDKLDSSCGD